MTAELVNRDAEIPAADYYVTVRESARKGARTGFLLGPYTDYLDCVANLRRGRSLVNQRNLDPFAQYLYGHARVPQDGSPRPRAMFGV